MPPALPKARKDIGMEGMVAKWYAANTGKTLDEFTKLALRIGSQLPPGSTVLEVAPGPGYFSIELAKLGPYSIAGLDISHTFVELARKKAAKAGVPVDFRPGNASQMPFVERFFRLPLVPRGFQELRTAGSCLAGNVPRAQRWTPWARSEEHTSELQSLRHLVCR